MTASKLIHSLFSVDIFGQWSLLQSFAQDFIQGFDWVKKIRLKMGKPLILSAIFMAASQRRKRKAGMSQKVQLAGLTCNDQTCSCTLLPN